mmetsp:Transcript_11511/g.20741  ORF Transcript_11511/g.20741 Transcript_11511/m.20741 type:complete len:469 (-) Transcript_11511:16-1422(-)
MAFLGTPKAEEPAGSNYSNCKEAVVKSTGSGENVYLLSCAFNQDQSCFVCGTTAGFRVYTLSPIHEVRRREHAAEFENRSVSLVAMLYKTNIFAMVTASHDATAGGLHKVQIWDEHKGKFVGELRSRSEVKGVTLRRDIIVMVCEYAIYVYTCDELKVILHLTTNANARGLCVLAAASDPWILCCPGQSTGAVRVQVGRGDQATHVFQAHKSALAAAALTASGSLVATASQQGTVVKVFQTSDGQQLYRLRRSTRPAAISCLSFRSDDCFLAVASSSSTVHVFKLCNSSAAAAPTLARGESLDSHDALPAGLKTDEDSSAAFWGGAIQKVTQVTTRAAAETVSDVVKGLSLQYFNDLRSFAQFRLPDFSDRRELAVDVRSSQQAHVVGPQVAFHETEPMLFVLHYDGVLYECSFKLDWDASLGTQDCGLICGTTWFATRPEFKIQGPVATIPGGAQEGDPEADEWQGL